MDRFIVFPMIALATLKYDLKSNMDRFIGKTFNKQDIYKNF